MGISNGTRAADSVRFAGPDRYQTNLALGLAERGSGGFPFDTSDATSSNASGLAAANTWYTMQLKVAGSGANVTITTSFDGTPVHDCQITTGTLASGGAGTYIYGPNTIAEFDDVKISTP